MNFLFYTLIFIFGLAVGSFLNVVICRLETGEGIVKNRSHCPQCAKALRWHDLIPVLSFVVLRGRCRYCREKISWQYPSVEIATGLLFLLILNFEFRISNQFLISNFQITNFVFICYMLYVICSLVAIFVYDLRHYIIPDKIIYPAIAAVLLFRILNLGFVPTLSRILDGIGISNFEFRISNFETLLDPLLSAFAAAAFFLALVLITRGRGMGLGDVKLAFLMGLVLGWPQILLALFSAFASGAIVGIGLVIAGKKALKSQIPFGPFLAAATVLVMLYGDKIIRYYFNLIWPL